MTFDPVIWGAALGAGIMLGALYMALLWGAVRGLTGATGPDGPRIGRFMVRMLLRLAAVLGALYLALRLDLALGAIAVAAIGFALARLAITGVMRRRGQGGT